MWTDCIGKYYCFYSFIFKILSFFFFLWNNYIFCAFIITYIFLLLQLRMETHRPVKLQAAGREPVSPKSTWNYLKWLSVWTLTLVLVSGKVYLKPPAYPSHVFRYVNNKITI